MSDISAATGMNRPRPTKRQARRLANRLSPYAFVGPAIVVLFIALIIPLGYMIYGSMLDWTASQSIGEADFIGLKNYTDLWNDPRFMKSVSVTLRFAFIVVVVELIIGVGLALLLDRDIKGMTFLRTMFILPMMIAPVVVGLMWRFMYHPTDGTFNRLLEKLGLPTVDWLGQHALMSVIIADIWQWTPFIFILALAALQSLPRSALEAARIDGATPWQQIIYIKLPLMMPVLIVTALLRLIDAFKVLEVILVLTNGGPGQETQILSHRINETMTEVRHLGEAAAMANYLLILLMALTLGMLAFNSWQEKRTARIRAAAEEDI